jgi:formylglycine-generating enzyme required for sulfatase activity
MSWRPFEIPIVTPGLKYSDSWKNPKDGLTYVWIPPGTFQIGCSPGDSGCGDYEKPAHSVTITKGFWIGQTPVTQVAYHQIIGKSPSHSQGLQRPVEMVSWYDAEAYCMGVGLRLPTEAEWEYAARAGSTYPRYGELDSIAWYKTNSNSETHDVAQKQPNAWKLYDMLGNVYEWTADLEGLYTAAAAQDPTGPASGQYRVVRGFSYGDNSPFALRVSFRFWESADSRHPNFGFRCAGQLQ